jgi:flagellar L-ring protein precursor FlgH
MKKKYACISSLAGAALLLAPLTAGAQSLWLKPANNERGFIADPKAHARGDLLTVTINENSTVVTSLRLNTDKEADISNRVTQWLFSPQASGFGTHNGETPATEIDGSNEYDAGGEISNSQTLETTLTVVVVDTLPNGVLVVEGGRAITTTNETFYAVFRGLVRPADVSAANTVASERVADARLELLNEGSLSEAQKKGWLLRFNERVNPF